MRLAVEHQADVHVADVAEPARLQFHLAAVGQLRAQRAVGLQRLAFLANAGRLAQHGEQVARLRVECLLRVHAAHRERRRDHGQNPLHPCSPVVQRIVQRADKSGNPCYTMCGG